MEVEVVEVENSKPEMTHSPQEPLEVSEEPVPVSLAQTSAVEEPVEQPTTRVSLSEEIIAQGTPLKTEQTQISRTRFLPATKF